MSTVSGTDKSAKLRRTAMNPIIKNTARTDTSAALWSSKYLESIYAKGRALVLHPKVRKNVQEAEADVPTNT